MRRTEGSSSGQREDQEEVFKKEESKALWVQEGFQMLH